MTTRIDPATQVVSAMYSGVAVWEIQVAGTIIMRRREDSYMNATQILKIAGLNKAKRTRVLEREILPDPRHEKVQGGYGKYQGTWIPLDMANDLAKKYKVHQQLRPLLEHDPNTPVPGRSQMLAPSYANASDVSSETSSYHGDSHSVSSWPEDDEEGGRRKSRTASPFGDESPRRGGLSLMDKRSKPNTPRSNLAAENGRAASPRRVGRPKQQKRVFPSQKPDPTHIQPLTSYHTPVRKEDIMKQADRQREILGEIFMEESPHNISKILDLLLDKAALKRAQESGMVNLQEQTFMEVDMALDLEGHTALHWATALGRVETVRQLLRYRANPKQLNFNGETALMRAVFVVNNFDRKTFYEMLDLLSDVVFYCDNSGKTLLHHIAITCGSTNSKQLQVASYFYMRTLLKWLDDNGGRLPVFVDFQDKHGDTALAVAARFGNAQLVEMLLSVDARADIPNQANLTPIAYAANNPHVQRLFTTRPRMYYAIPDSLDPQANIHSETRYPDHNPLVPMGIPQSHPIPTTDPALQDTRAKRLLHHVESVIRVMHDQAANQIGQRDKKLQLVQENVRDVSEQLAEASRRSQELESVKNNVESGTRECHALEQELFSLLVDGPGHFTDYMNVEHGVGDLPMSDPTVKVIDETNGEQVKHEVTRLRRLIEEYRQRGELAKSHFAKWEQDYNSQTTKYLEVITKCTDVNPNDLDERTLKALMNELKAE